MDRTCNNYYRFIVTLMVFFLCYFIILANLYLLQITQTNFFKTLADKQYNITVQTLPQRAYIFDRDNIFHKVMTALPHIKIKVSCILKEIYPQMKLNC